LLIYDGIVTAVINDLSIQGAVSKLDRGWRLQECHRGNDTAWEQMCGWDWVFQKWRSCLWLPTVVKAFLQHFPTTHLG